MIYLVGAAWIACGVVSYGLYIGTFQHNPHWVYMAYSNRHIDRLTGVIVSVFGPVSLVAALIAGGGRIRFRCQSREAAEAAAKKDFPCLYSDPAWRHDKGFS